MPDALLAAARGLTRRLLPHAIELVILALLAVAAVAAGPPALMSHEVLSHGPANAPETLANMVGHNLTNGGAGLILVFWLLLLTRLVRWRALFVVLAVALPVAGLLAFHVTWVLPIMREVAGEPTHSILRPGIPVSIALLSLRPGLLLLVPVLAALYATRRGWSPLLYALGWAGGMAVMLAGFRLFWTGTWENGLVPAIVLNGVFAAAMVSLPLQRRRMEALTGIALTRNPDPPLRPASGLASTLGHAGLVIVLAATAFLSAASYYEHRMARLVSYGADPTHVSPGAVDAYPVLRNGFVRDPPRGTSPAGEAVQAMAGSVPEFDRRMLDGIPVMGPEHLRAYVGAADRTALDRYLAEMAPYLATFREAAEADTCMVHEPDRLVLPDFLVVRSAARALDLRAALALLDGRTTDALADIETLFRFGGVLGSDPSGIVVQHMIASAVRGIGISAAQKHYLATRDDPAAARALADTLERIRTVVCVSFPAETIRRTEMGFWPMVPYYEMVVPGLNRAYVLFYANWAAYDQLRLRLALDAYRRGHGAFPGALDALVPAFLRRLPREPFEGNPYTYALANGEPVITVPFLERITDRNLVTNLLRGARELEEAGAEHVKKTRARETEQATP